MIKDNLNFINNKVTAACLRSGRNVADVDLMLVTKTVPSERIHEAVDLGYKLFGENKVQEVTQKWNSQLLPGVKPEFIGHLQTNKVKVCLDSCSRIHSVDRMSLVEALDRELQKRGEQREVFLQVNTSDEESKYGVSCAEAVEFAQKVSKYSTLKVTGLMTLAIFSKDEDKVRTCFKNLKQVQNEIRAEGIFLDAFKHLSMGMSSDYEIAIAEGATIIRVGTAIFGTRATPDFYYWPEDKK